MADIYLDLIKRRHTEYSISAKSTISNERIIEIASDVIKHTPSSFNCQSTRYVVLLEEHHVRLWEIAKKCFQATMSTVQYQDYEKKLSGRQAGYGTILLYEDMNTIRDFQVKFPRFQHHLLDFSEANNAMQAFNLWTALSLEGLGCNLQHVNPIIDQRVLAEWNIPRHWSLRAQLVFGLPTGEPNHDKTVIAADERIMVNGSKLGARAT